MRRDRYAVTSFSLNSSIEQYGSVKTSGVVEIGNGALGALGALGEEDKGHWSRGR